MESLRKYLGVIVLGILGVAFAVGAIIQLTDAGTVFKGVKDFDSLLQLAFAWLSRSIIWTIAAIVGIVALVKSADLDAKGRDNKVAKLVALGALAEFLGALGLIILSFKVKAYKVDGKVWVILILSALVLVAGLVRKISFGENVLINKIMAAAMALVLFVVIIMVMGDSKAGKWALTCVLFMLGYIAACAHPLLSSDLK